MHRGRILIAALAALAIATSPVRAAPPPFVIDDDYGGIVDTFMMWYKRLADSGAPVVLRGICVSACTLVLRLPKSQVCVEPTASLGFHLWAASGKPDVSLTAAGVRRYYPIAVQEWLKKQEALLIWPITFMTAEEIVALGIFPACEAEQPKAEAEPPPKVEPPALESE